MLKKSITLLAVVAVAGIAFATESAPSNGVGFVTVTVSELPEQYNHITIQPRGTEIDGDRTEIWGSQFIGALTSADSDLLEEFNNYGWDNLWRYVNPPYVDTWVGTIANIDHYKSYLYKNRQGAGSVTKVFAGDVIPCGTLVDMGNIVDMTNAALPGYPGRTFVANPLPMTRQITGVAGDIYNLVGSGFTIGYSADKIEHYADPGWDNCFTGDGVNWYGTISALQPGVGYVIVDNTAGADYNWTFTACTDMIAGEQTAKKTKVSSHK